MFLELIFLAMKFCKVFIRKIKKNGTEWSQAQLKLKALRITK